MAMIEESLSPLIQSLSVDLMALSLLALMHHDVDLLAHALLAQALLALTQALAQALLELTQALAQALLALAKVRAVMVQALMAQMASGLAQPVSRLTHATQTK